MASTHLSLHYHLVFSTKNREPWITVEHRDRVLAGLRATHCVAVVMRELKSESSGWIHRELNLPWFAWQEGYGAFTVSASHIEQARAYVLNQEQHHRGKTFPEEYVEMLKRGMVEYDERYLW